MSNTNVAHINNNGGGMTTAAAPVVDEGPSPFVQPGVDIKKLMPTRIHFLDNTEHTFHVHQKAKGSILIDLVAAQLELREKDYFGLAYYDDQKLQHWLYPEKRIKKQLKGLPLEFWFQVKFYPPQPAQLTEDLTRYLLYLQLRRDVHTERLPVSFAAQANLGAFVAQAMLGDYRRSEEYADHLNSARIAQPTTEQEQFIGHVREMHKQHRGLTPQEAELNYLNACKALAMYGVHLFPAKDSKGKAVQVGVSAHGISLYSEQMRIHRFAWPGIIKFSFRRYHFNVKLKAGEIDSKKEASLTYNLSSYEHAKLLWKCAVEHHGFFRLIQPDRKGKHHFLSFGSARFRYTGRTNIQSQMASQLFETPTVDDHLKSKSVDQIALKGPTEHPSPMNYADEATPQKSKQPQQQNEQQPSMVTSLHYQEVGDRF
uniref:Moesin/ezrin/radixin homolog 1 n=1 Tax=Globodera pallida TaxID=36090 RepID=A0A183CL21_GLOPA